MKRNKKGQSVIELGRINKLIVLGISNGVYQLGDRSSDTVSMIGRYTEKKYEVGEEIEVMVYRDKDGRLLATDRQPRAQRGQFAGLKAVHITKAGAFLNWGVPRDLFVPPKEQKFPMQKGKYYIVYITMDENTGRLMGSSRIDRFINPNPCDLDPGSPVELLIEAETDLGYRAIVNHNWFGLLYRNEVFQEIKVGRNMSGYIKHIRPDGKIDLSLEKPGFSRMENHVKNLLEALESHHGILSLTDKSDPRDIYDLLGMSKKTFKMAVGILYKKKKISLEKDKIRLL